MKRAVEDRRPADLAEDLAADQPRPVPRGLPLRGGERVDGDVAGHPAHDEDEETDEHEREADVPQCLPALTARQVDRERVHREHQDQQRGAEDAHALHGGLGRGELVGAHDRDHPGVRGDLRHRGGRQPELGPDLGHERAQVQRHDAVAGRDPVARLVLEHVDELLLRDRIGVDPELLHAWRLEQPLDAVRGGLAQRGGGGLRQRLEVGGQPLLESGGDIDVVVELVDQEHRERALDLRVLDQLGARGLPGLVVEHLPVDPGREDRSQPDQRGENDQRPHERATTPGHAAGDLIGGQWCGLGHSCIVLRDALRQIISKG